MKDTNFVRHATKNDVAPIMQLIAEVVPAMHAAGNFQWDSVYPNPGAFNADIDAHQLWVADLDGDIAGVAAITTEQYPEYAQVGLDVSQAAIVVHRLAVSPRHQGKGIAAALLQEAEAEAGRQGIAILRIDTNKQNLAAQALFPKMDYVYKGEISLEFRPGMGFVVFEKLLSPR